MCGRFSLTTNPQGLQETFPDFIFPQGMCPRFNIAPGQPVLVLPNNGRKNAEHYLWGLIPSWAKDPAIRSKLINARAETLIEKPSFRSAFRYRRCLIPADGFFEWRKEPDYKAKSPFYFQLRSKSPFCLAGLWECWTNPDGSKIFSTTIITTTANDLVAPFHERMPVILHRSVYKQWIDPTLVNPSQLQAYLLPYPEDEMSVVPVSSAVNDTKNDSAEIVRSLS